MSSAAYELSRTLIKPYNTHLDVICFPFTIRNISSSTYMNILAEKNEACVYLIKKIIFMAMFLEYTRCYVEKERKNIKRREEESRMIHFNEFASCLILI
jgi:hypothetical protein